MTVADRIRERREQLGLTQDELAHRMGYTGKSSISKIETSGNDITLKKISKIAPALETSEAYLMGWVTDPAQDYIESDEGQTAAIANRLLAINERINNIPNSELTNQSFNEKEVKEAIDLYEQYQAAPPEVRNAIALLLKPPKSDS